VSGSDLGALLPILLLVLVFWFLVLRPARNRQRQMATLQSELAVGADVMLSSGVFGKVIWLGDETLKVEIAPETTIRVHRQAVGKVLSDEESVRMASESSEVSEPGSSSDAGESSDDSSTDTTASPDRSARPDKGD
jgi:preprotein translocase subunit YajC